MIAFRGHLKCPKKADVDIFLPLSVRLSFFLSCFLSFFFIDSYPCYISLSNGNRLKQVRMLGSHMHCLARRQLGHITLATLDPLRINQALTLRIQLLVRTTNGSVADMCHLGDLLGRLAMAHQE